MGYFFFNKPGSWQIAGFWAGTTGLIYSMSTIAYNAQLVDIGNNHWLIKHAKRINASKDRVIKLSKSILDDISQFGYCAGYLGSLFMTIIALAIIAIVAVPFKYNTDIYGISDGTAYEEYYAKTVTNIDMTYVYNNQNSYITAIQFEYDFDGTPIYGNIVGNNAINVNGYITVNDSFVVNVDDQIDSLYLWFNDDKSIRAIQFSTVNDVNSMIFGVNNTTPTIVEAQNKAKGYYMQGYQSFSSYNSNINSTIISGLDFLFVNPDSEYESTRPLQVIMITVFIWWFGIQIFTLCTMKKRRKPDIPSESSVFTVSIKGFWYTLKDAKKYPELIKFMIAWFFYSDAICMYIYILFLNIYQNI